MSSSFDLTTAFDALDDSLVSDVVDLDSWCSSLSPPISSDEPVHHSTPRPRQKRHPRTRGHPRPSPAFALSPVTPSVAAPPVLSTSAVASSSAQSSSAPEKPDKGKGRQQATPVPPSTGSVDPSPIPATSSADLTPEQHLCLVWVLKRLDEWLACGWEPRVDQSRLRSLAEIFNSAETVAEGGIANLCLADLTWRLADSEGWERSAGSSIMGAIDIQVTVTKILYRDYGDSLIDSWTAQMEELATFARKGMREAHYLLTRRMPTFRCMMQRAGVSLSISRLLVERLMAGGEISYSLSESPLPELTPSALSTPLLRSLTRLSSPSSPVANFGTSSPVAECLPTPTPLADIGVFDATPSVTGLPTMTELVEQFMEDLLTQEFSPTQLDEDI